MCRDASPDNFTFMSGLACRVGGALGSGPLYFQCLEMCTQLFLNKQAQNAYKDWQQNSE
jgi:hypothetical protein